MAERSSTPEPFDCKTPPNEIDKTIPTLEPFVFTLDPQNVEEALEYINEHNLNSAKFWRDNCLKPSSKYAQKSMKLKYRKSLRCCKNRTEIVKLGATTRNTARTAHHNTVKDTKRKEK